MATGVQNAFSTTAASNATSDTAVNQREGMAPSAVNDSARAIMALIKKWCKDWQGGLVTGGASTAFTLTTNEVLALADGVSVKCRMHATSGASPTLNVDSTGAVAIQSVQGTALPTGALPAGSVHSFVYYAAAAAWIVSGIAAPASDTVAGGVELATVAEAGTGTDTARAVTPAGLFPAEADVASAATANIGAAASSKVRITGTTTITAFDTVAAGLYREGRFADALTFTHGAALLLPGVANITTAANDRFGALSLGSGNWIVLWYQKATGRAVIVDAASDTVAGAIEIATNAEVEAGSSGTLAVTPGRQSFHPGHPKAGGNFNGTGTPAFRSGDYGMGAITDNGTGNYTLALDTAFNDTNYWINGWARFTVSNPAGLLSALDADTKTASSLQVRTSNSTSASAFDSSEVGISFWGDYA